MIIFAIVGLLQSPSAPASSRRKPKFKPFAYPIEMEEVLFLFQPPKAGSNKPPSGREGDRVSGGRSPTRVECEIRKTPTDKSQDICLPIPDRRGRRSLQIRIFLSQKFRAGCSHKAKRIKSFWPHLFTKRWETVFWFHLFFEKRWRATPTPGKARLSPAPTAKAHSRGCGGC